jgi:hypothetical protein
MLWIAFTLATSDTLDAPPGGANLLLEAGRVSDFVGLKPPHPYRRNRTTNIAGIQEHSGPTSYGQSPNKMMYSKPNYLRNADYLKYRAQEELKDKTGLQGYMACYIKRGCIILAHWQITRYICATI